ncbi:hypothetical protein TYRP_007003 [Tyrophagus putrescentiae]|nr:hypothetical protein TYRP_007003 [Tyrophagus putrescentiae]
MLWLLLTCLVDAKESRRVGLSARCCFCHRHGLRPPPKTSTGPATRTSQPHSSLGSPSPSSPSSSSSSSLSLLHRLSISQDSSLQITKLMAAQIIIIIIIIILFTIIICRQLYSRTTEEDGLVVAADSSNNSPLKTSRMDGWMDGLEDGLDRSSKSRMASPPDHHHQQQQQSLAWTA